MIVIEDDYAKFDDVLREALVLHKVSFSDDGILIDFDKKSPVFRVVTREPNDIYEICKNDFLSHIERYKLGEHIKGVSSESEYDLNYYSCSFFKNKKDLQRIMKLPKKKKYLIRGYICSDNGIIKINQTTGHIDLWRFKNSMIHKQFSYDNSGENNE